MITVGCCEHHEAIEAAWRRAWTHEQKLRRAAEARVRWLELEVKSRLNEIALLEGKVRVLRHELETREPF